MDAQVQGDELTARIELPGGLGADLRIAFEDAVGLQPDQMGLDARLIDPADPVLLARLPGLRTLPLAAFPVLVILDAPPTSPLSFQGVAAIELYTHDLFYVPGSRLRLFAAAPGEPFGDATTASSGGSYRVGIRKPDFNLEILILEDLRLLDDVIGLKFDRIQTLLDAYAGSISGWLLAELESRLNGALAAYDNGLTEQAIGQIEAFAALVEENGGSEIPDVWRASGDLVNMAGALRGAADTLRFSLVEKSNGSPLP